MRVDARAQSLCCVQWGAEALEVQPLSPSPDGIRKSRVQWGPRPWQWATESVGSREGGQSLATCVSRPLQTLGRGHQAEQGAVQFHLPGTWRRPVCDACGCVCVCVCVWCVLGFAELQSLSILEPKAWRCQCSCPCRYFILEEKLSLVCSLYLG